MSFTWKENNTIGEKYGYQKHKSGVDLYVIPKNHRTGYAVFGTYFGSIDNHFSIDGSEVTLPDGIAHFLEHKLFENEDGVDTFQKYAEYGASANAYTGSDKTVYLFSATENFLESLEILLDFVTKPYFTEETVKKEQGIIGQEIRMYDDNPGWRLYFNMLRAMYVNHPVRIDTAGTAETISRITPETLFDAYRAFYNLHNMALCVCADIDPFDVERIADNILRPSPRQTVRRIFPEEPETVGQETVSQRLEVSMPLFAVGIKDSDLPLSGRDMMKKNAQTDILLELIFGKSSPFYTRMYEAGLINATFSYGYENHRNFAHCEISGYSNHPDRVYEEIRKEIDEIGRSGFNNEDFERARRVIYARGIRVFNHTEDIANGFLSYVFTGGDMLDYPSVIAQTTRFDIEKRFRNTFREHSFTLSKILPISK